MSKYKQLIETLVADKMPPEEISALIAEVSKASAMKIYTQTIMALTEDEKKQLETVEDEDQSNALVLSFYQAHYGKTPQEATEELEEEFAEKFMAEYKKDKGANA